MGIGVICWPRWPEDSFTASIAAPQLIRLRSVGFLVEGSGFQV